MKNAVRIAVLLILLAATVFVGKSKLGVFFYNQGINYYDKLEYKKAIESFNNSLKFAPNVAQVHCSLANAYFDDKSEDRAIDEYKKTLQLDDHFVDGYKMLAHIYLSKGLYNEATDILRKGENALPNNQEIKSLIGDISFERMAEFLNSGVDAFSKGDKDLALGLLQKAVEAKPDYAFSRYTLAYIYYADNKYDQAISQLESAIHIDSRFIMAYKLLGDIYFEKKEFARAIEIYEAAFYLDVNDSGLLNNIGLCYMNLEEYDVAARFLMRGITRDPGNINLRYSLASVYRDSARLDDAVKEYLNIIDAIADYPHVHNDLASIYKMQGRKDEAFKEYRKELEYCQNKLNRDPNNPYVLNDLADAYNGLGEYEKAKEAVDKALLIKPDFYQAYLTRAAIYKEMGDFSQEVEALEKAKSLTPQKYFYVEKAIGRAKESLKNNMIKMSPFSTVYLKNGRYIKGVIRQEDKDALVLEVNVGSGTGVISLSRSDVERVVDDDK
ncbi:MAG: tetratricopeptide repeat protein [Candidatus Omnitrophica bacterium]|nr:tetratricopeptide repeat protein [Candidatus Omnitrophota bacterium]MBU1869782.1 tetratricopeptide repeat protein [Candidatus Omnitrophota bacterium]